MVVCTFVLLRVADAAVVLLTALRLLRDAESVVGVSRCGLCSRGSQGNELNMHEEIFMQSKYHTSDEIVVTSNHTRLIKCPRAKNMLFPFVCLERPRELTAYEAPICSYLYPLPSPQNLDAWKTRKNKIADAYVHVLPLEG